MTNPYIAIDAIFNRAVLKSNLGNSTAMYSVKAGSNGYFNT